MRRSRLILGEYRALEEELWREIEHLQAAGSLAPVTVVAPSRWLVRHLKLSALRRFPEGLFGVRLANFFQFALDLAGDAARSFVAQPVFYERILLDWLESLGPEDHPFPAAEAWTYDFAGALAAAVRDLRDAAVARDPQLILERLRAAVGETDTRLSVMDVRKFAGLLRAYCDYADALHTAGVLDRAELYRVAAANAARLSSPLLVYGFYDMTQVQADFVAEVARHTSVSLFVPYGAEGEDWKFGEWFRDTFAPSVTAETVRLHVQLAMPTPEIHSARGEAGEVWFCAKEIRRLLDQGCQAYHIAVVARTLDPYLRHVEESFREHSIPYEGPSSRSLIENPLAQMIRRFFRAALEDFPRASMLDVVCHPLFRASDARRYWNLLARVLRISHGTDWHRLERYVETGYRLVTHRPEKDDRKDKHGVFIPPEEVAGLWQAVSALMSRTWLDQASWREHAEAHRAALDEAVRSEGLLEEEVTVLDAIRGVLGSLSLLDGVCAPVSRGSFLDAFERECQRRFLENPSVRGVAVLDAMAVRGLSFRQIFLLGMNARLFPRFIVEEPFISDAVRREVFRVLGHHLAVRMDGYDEERLLFHLVRQTASERLVCIYQRADAKGRLRDPSPFLRPFLPLDRASIDAIPHADSARRARAFVRTPREQIIAASDTERALAAFGYDNQAYSRGRAFLTEIDRSREIGQCEGHTGPLPWYWKRRSADGFSATQLEVFALCPFKYFARHVLDLLSLEERVSDDDLAPLEIGSLMHSILERLYRALAEHAFGRDALGVVLDSAAAEVCREFEDREGVALRGLLAVRWQQIIRAVEAFAAWDLANLGEWEPSWFEEEAEGEIAGLRIRARIDRVDRHRATGDLRVIDYKRRFGQHWKTRLETQARRGQKLQAPLYMEVAPAIARRHGRDAVRATETVFHFIENYAREDPSVQSIHGGRMAIGLGAEQWMAARERVEIAITTFARMIREGWFFPRPETRRGGHCTWCDFAGVCRKGYGDIRRKAEPDRTTALGPYWEIVRGSD